MNIGWKLGTSKIDLIPASTFYYRSFEDCRSGPSCSKITMSLVNISLKLSPLNMAYMVIFFAEKKNVSSFCIFVSKNTCELDIALTRTVNILTTNELVKLTTLWTTGSWCCLNNWALVLFVSLWRVVAELFFHAFPCSLCDWYVKRILYIIIITLFGKTELVGLLCLSLRACVKLV